MSCCPRMQISDTHHNSWCPHQSDEEKLKNFDSLVRLMEYHRNNSVFFAKIIQERENSKKTNI
jgi:hypothetical protein